MRRNAKRTVSDCVWATSFRNWYSVRRYTIVSHDTLKGQIEGGCLTAWPGRWLARPPSGLVPRAVASPHPFCERSQIEIREVNGARYVVRACTTEEHDYESEMPFPKYGIRRNVLVLSTALPV
jgi:hypothetical protein